MDFTVVSKLKCMELITSTGVLLSLWVKHRETQYIYKIGWRSYTVDNYALHIFSDQGFFFRFWEQNIVRDKMLNC